MELDRVYLFKEGTLRRAHKVDLSTCFGKLYARGNHKTGPKGVLKFKSQTKKRANRRISISIIVMLFKKISSNNSK